MRKLNYVYILSLIFLLFSGCSDEGIQPKSLDSGDDISLKSAKSKHYVPFKATFEVYVDKVTHLSPPPKMQEVIGVGNATHLGLTEILMEQSWWPPVPIELPFTGTGIGKVTFTAANGDKLLAEYDNAKAIHEGPTSPFVNVTFTGHFVDGGTGRFEKAQGTFEYKGIYNKVTNEGTATLTGKIMYHK